MPCPRTNLSLTRRDALRSAVLLPASALAARALARPGRQSAAASGGRKHEPPAVGRHRPGPATRLPAGLGPPPGGYGTEAARVTDLMYKRFWNHARRMFCAPCSSAETVPGDPGNKNGYTFWPSILALEALSNAERLRPGVYGSRIATVASGLEQYFDPVAHAYDAWIRFPGNNDRYYDDNSWAVITLAEAARATGHWPYLDRACEIMSGFIYGGWDESSHPGGERWGTDPTKQGTSDRTACATAGAALAALTLADAGMDRDRNIRWAARALTWVRDHLQDNDGLVRDGLRSPGWSTMPTKWTYNTGVAIRGHVLHYRLTGDERSLKEAARMGRAATDRTGALYDSVVQDPARRFWFDDTYFTHYLADGLMQLCNTSPSLHIRAEVERNASFCYHYISDPSDGLYFRNWRLWRIGRKQYAAWRAFTGQTFHLDPDLSERSAEARYASKPVIDRPLVKTLLANAGAARLFWTLA